MAFTEMESIAFYSFGSRDVSSASRKVPSAIVDPSLEAAMLLSLISAFCSQSMTQSVPMRLSTAWSCALEFYSSY